MSAKVNKGVLTRHKGLIHALLIANSMSLLLFTLRVIDSGNFRYWFLVWNLVLAWLPLMFALWLTVRLRTQKWLEPGNVILTVLWLGFLPNSFYLVSDLIHLQTTSEVSVLYDAVLFTSLIFNGFVSGCISLYFVHIELLKRISARIAHSLIGIVLLLCSFAIYLGRALRWNTWDVFLHPTSLIFDVSEQVVNRAAQSRASVTTFSFFILLGGMYMVIWQLAKARD